jgi:pimeloyl-ACP methyl ester carboxylesterase
VSSLLLMPRMGETMESGRVTAWLKKPGEAFARGEIIAEIETDKVTVELPALDSGRLVEILAEEGSQVAVGEALGRYDPAVTTNMPAQHSFSKAPTAAAPPPILAAEAPPLAAIDPPVPTERVRATPSARRLARDMGVELASVTGTGRRRRIERHDVKAASPSGSTILSPTSSLPELRFIRLPQGRMAYREWGPHINERRTMLLLHGFSAESGAWGSVASALGREGAHVVVPDLPGHGGTEIDALDFESVSELIAAFAKAKELLQAELIGHSMGGAIAARLAAEGKLDAPRLTLIAPAGMGDAISADFIHGVAKAASGGALAHLLRYLARDPPAVSRPQLEKMAKALRSGRLIRIAEDLASNGKQGIDIVSDLAALTIPVRLIWGLEDRIIPWMQAAAAPSRVPVHLVSGAGHMPHWDRPKDILALLHLT